MCMDDEVQKENCPFYKAAGDCEANKNGMRYWCPKTCGFCKCMYIDSLYAYTALPIPLLLFIELWMARDRTSVPKGGRIG